MGALNAALLGRDTSERLGELRGELEEAGRELASETDTEVIAHLITHYLEEGNQDPLGATRKTLGRLEGAFALGIIFAGHPELMIAARRGSDSD